MIRTIKAIFSPQKLRECLLQCSSFWIKNIKLRENSEVRRCIPGKRETNLSKTLKHHLSSQNHLNQNLPIPLLSFQMPPPKNRPPLNHLIASLDQNSPLSNQNPQNSPDLTQPHSTQIPQKTLFTSRISRLTYLLSKRNQQFINYNPFFLLKYLHQSILSFFRSSRKN